MNNLKLDCENLREKYNLLIIISEGMLPYVFNKYLITSAFLNNSKIILFSMESSKFASKMSCTLTLTKYDVIQY